MQSNTMSGLTVHSIQVQKETVVEAEPPTEGDQKYPVNAV